MRSKKSFSVTAAVLALSLSAMMAVALTAASSAHATVYRLLCRYNVAPVSGGFYLVQNDEWNSTASECISNDGLPDFTVVNSAITQASYKPGGYPSIYAGCHWGLCSRGGLASAPQLVSALTPGALTTDLSVSEPTAGGSAYNVAYDIWINQSPRATGRPNGAEIMVWLDHKGPPRPAGSVVATGVTIGGQGYNVWYRRPQGAGGGTTSYEMTTPATAVSNLDVGTLVQDSVARGYASPQGYLIDVEAGFEIWRGGAGLAVRQFGVRLNNTFAGTGHCVSAPPWHS